MLWGYIGLVAVITVADLFFFRWVFGVSDFGIPLLLSFSVAVFLCLILFIFEKDKRGFMAAGFSIVALWASLLVQVGEEIPMSILLDGAIFFFAPFLIITARETVAENIRFVPVLLSGLAESALIFGLIQGVVLLVDEGVSPLQFVVLFR